MFTFHKPKVFRSANGCCICKAKSSSSRFTDSKRYEAYFEKCFSLEEERSGEICNACVLLVKRYIKLPAGSTRHWNHVVDARSGPGIKSLVKSKNKQKLNEPNNTNSNSKSSRDENDTPEKINKKHFYRSKRKPQPAMVRKRNPSIPVSGFLDMSRWKKEKVCCGIIFRGPHGEVAIDPRFMNYCLSCKSIKEPLAPIISSSNDNTTTTSTTTEDSISKNTNSETSDVAVDDMETDTDSSSTISGSGPDNLPMSSSSAAATALVHHHHNKLVDGAEDDEGFFDKPAVSPSESGTSTPPPSSDPEIAPHEYIRDDMVNTT